MYSKREINEACTIHYSDARITSTCGHLNDQIVGNKKPGLRGIVGLFFKRYTSCIHVKITYGSCSTKELRAQIQGYWCLMTLEITLNIWFL